MVVLLFSSQLILAVSRTIILLQWAVIIYCSIPMLFFLHCLYVNIDKKLSWGKKLCVYIPKSLACLVNNKYYLLSSIICRQETLLLYLIQ